MLKWSIIIHKTKMQTKIKDRFGFGDDLLGAARLVFRGEAPALQSSGETPPETVASNEEMDDVIKMTAQELALWQKEVNLRETLHDLDVELAVAFENRKTTTGEALFAFFQNSDLKSGEVVRLAVEKMYKGDYVHYWDAVVRLDKGGAVKCFLEAREANDFSKEMREIEEALQGILLQKYQIEAKAV